MDREKTIVKLQAKQEGIENDIMQIIDKYGWDTINNIIEEDLNKLSVSGQTILGLGFCRMMLAHMQREIDLEKMNEDH
jgi:hypothetical protein